MSQPLVLVVDDEPDIRGLVREILEDEGYAVAEAENVSTAREVINEQLPDLVLLDIWMPDQDGVSLLKEWRDQGALKFPVVMISGHGTVETAVEATRLGAVDFIEKPLSLARLLLSVEKAIDGFSRSEDVAVDARVRVLPDIIGASDYIKGLHDSIERAAEGGETGVLLQGERGTGKLLLSQHIHRASDRAGMPFIQLRCDSLDENNLHHDLLGDENSAGYLESANGGVLCLIDVEELPDAAQSLLLEAVENGSVVRGGSAVNLNIRLLATTTTSLSARKAEGLFNESLYYHLSVLSINTLPLREHKEDIPALLTYYVDKLVEQEALAYRHFSVAAQNYLRNRDWPGNIVELVSAVKRLLILGEQVEIDLPELEKVLAQHETSVEPVANDMMRLPLDAPLREARAEFERRYLEHQLDRVNGNIVELARVVGMERTHLYRKLRSVGIQAGRKRS